MRLQDFHLELFERPSAAQQSSLDELHQEVFTAVETLPDAITQPDDETADWHVLARDTTDHALGCGRLADGGRIECIAVRETWRRQGIGTAILRELIARASALGMLEVTLDAPASALEFCRSAGFTARPAEAGDLGLLRHTLPLPSLRQPVEAAALRDTESLAAGSRSEIAAARLQLLADARYQLLVYLPALNDGIFGNVLELEQLRRVACSGRTASIRYFCLMISMLS